MMDLTLSDALARHWTRCDRKADLYSGDTWFLEAAQQLVDRGGEPTRVGAVGAGIATLLVKPDAVATGSATTVVEWLIARDFAIHDATVRRLDRNDVRALWLYQWNIASAERRVLADVLCGFTPSLVLVVGPGGRDDEVPCSVDLTAVKGPTAPSRRRPEHLRGALPGRSFLLNQVHTADEPADALRELGVYLDSGRRALAFDRVVAGHDASAEAHSLAARLDSEHAPARGIDVDAARARLSALAAPGEDDEAVCRRLLASPPAEPEDRWALLVLGSAVLPMRTPGSAEAILTAPDVEEWRTTALVPGHSCTLDRELVHRRSVAETFVTGLGPALSGPDGLRIVDAAVQIGRAHPVHTDHLGTQRGRCDLLQLMEACRQAAIAMSHRTFGAARSDAFLVRRFSGRFLTDLRMPADRPLDLTVRITAEREFVDREAGVVTGLDVLFDVYAPDTSAVARFSGSYTWLPPSRWATLRGDATTAPDTSAPSAAEAVPEPARVEPARVLREVCANSVVTPGSETPGGHPRLVVDDSHAVHFDHPLDHVPGMLQLEGARQAALLRLADSERTGVLLTAIDAAFVGFGELARPVYCEVSGDDSDDGSFGVRVTQDDRTITGVTLTLGAPV